MAVVCVLFVLVCIVTVESGRFVEVLCVVTLLVGLN